MTTQQKLFNQFMEQNYSQLVNQLPQRDMLHNAYVTVFHIHRPLLPTHDNFLRLMSDAYYRHMLKEFNHSMHFILPDPLFWMYRDELADDDIESLIDMQDDDTLQTDDTTNSSISDISEKDFSKIISYLRSKYAPEAVIIFYLAVLKQCSVAQIAEITGWKKKEVNSLLNRIELDLRNRKSNNKQQQK